MTPSPEREGVMAAVRELERRAKWNDQQRKSLYSVTVPAGHHHGVSIGYQHAADYLREALLGEDVEQIHAVETADEGGHS
jgi:hypothetical protein